MRPVRLVFRFSMAASKKMKMTMLIPMLIRCIMAMIENTPPVIAKAERLLRISCLFDEKLAFQQVQDRVGMVSTKLVQTFYELPGKLVRRVFSHRIDLHLIHREHDRQGYRVKHPGYMVSLRGYMEIQLNPAVVQRGWEGDDVYGPLPQQLLPIPV